MPITQVGTAVTNSNAAASVAGNLVVNVPSGVQDGDLLIACVYKALDSVHTLTAPAGWTQIGTAEEAPANINASMWRRVASSEPASYTWNISSTGIWGVAQVAFRGVDTTSPIHTSASTSGAATDPYSCPNLTTSAATYVVSFGASRDDSLTEVTHTATDTELADWGNDGGASTRNGAIYLSGEKSAGTVTGLSINPSGSINNYCAWSVALTQAVVTGSFSGTLPKVTSSVSATRVMPDGPIASTLPKLTTSMLGTAAPPSGSVSTSLPKVTSSLSGSATGGSFNSTLPKVTSSVAGGTELAGPIVSTLPSLSMTGIGETRPFGEQVILPDPERRAFRITDDDMIPIYLSQVTQE